MRVRVETILDANPAIIWDALLKRETFLTITRGMVSFDTATLPPTFEQGQVIRTHYRFFHVVPAWWEHTLNLMRVDHECRELLSSECGGFIRQWTHLILVRAAPGGKTHYIDQIDIHAGWMTFIVALYAHVFYRYRQMRWRKLARRLFTANSH